MRLINEYSGIDLSEKRDVMQIKLPNFIAARGLEDFKSFLEKLRLNRILRQQTIDFITVNETYFLRELAQLKEIIFHAKSLDRPVSLLSLPCSSGEEVYSLAILAAQNFLRDLHILGVDINAEVIERARAGRYQGRTLGRLSEAEKRRFFEEREGVFSVKRAELCPCKFETLNVFDYKFTRLGKFDLIASRNMMIYFDYDSKLRVLENFHKVLADDGRLYIGNADLVPESIYFKKVFSSRGVYYEKAFG